MLPEVMVRATTHRALWLARNVLPVERSLRNWLSRYRVAGLEVDDVVQETYAILCGLETIDHIRNPRQYAFQTAYSVVLRHVRHAKVVPMRTFNDLDQLQIALPDASPEQMAIDRDSLGELARFIATLPGRAQQVFILRRVEGLSQRDIAQKLHISESTVEKHISKALRLLSDHFGHGGEGGGDASTTGIAEECRKNGAVRENPPRNKSSD
jgi:RNA polymerase sigma factor (sigma-70 family)